MESNNDDVIKWKHFPRYWPFVREIHRSPVNFPHTDWWRRALMFSLICAWINGWVNNSVAGDLRRHRTHYDVTVMISFDRTFLVCVCAIADGLSRQAAETRLHGRNATDTKLLCKTITTSTTTRLMNKTAKHFQNDTQRQYVFWMKSK